MEKYRVTIGAYIAKELAMGFIPTRDVALINRLGGKCIGCHTALFEEKRISLVMVHQSTNKPVCISCSFDLIEKGIKVVHNEFTKEEMRKFKIEHVLKSMDQ